MQEKSQLPNVPPLSGPALVAGINEIARTLGTNFAGADDPAAMVWPYATWADTANGLLKRRNAADTAWVVEAELFERSARRNGDATQNFNVASLNGGQLAGFRNKILNGAFQINQRGYVSGAATTAGQYTFDRWKVTGTGGITYSTANNKTTVTIPAGQTLQQVIEGLNLQSGQYVLSWEGTAQGRVGSGTYGNSGEVIATIIGGVNTTIEFNAGTVANIQFEPGEVATSFEHRFFGQELALCQRYCFVDNESPYDFIGYATAGNLFSGTLSLPVPMRTAPTVVESVFGYTNCNSGQILPSKTRVLVRGMPTISGHIQLSVNKMTLSAEL